VHYRLDSATKLLVETADHCFRWTKPVPTHLFLLFDHDSRFGKDVIPPAQDMGSRPVRTALRSPWQNGVAERWVGSCRQDLLDHVIVLNERHLKRLMGDYVRYYHDDRTHFGLAKDTPAVDRRLSLQLETRSDPSPGSAACTIVTRSRLKMNQSCLLDQVAISDSGTLPVRAINSQQDYSKSDASKSRGRSVPAQNRRLYGVFA
jgi:Integrase core domain